jgi:hypothetical protein
MIPVISVLLVVILSVVVIRVATVALVHTGMGREAARFQARSAFTGVGYTTSEAESIVTHPVRRRIASQSSMHVTTLASFTCTRTMAFQIFASSPAIGWPAGPSRRLASRGRGYSCSGSSVLAVSSSVRPRQTRRSANWIRSLCTGELRVSPKSIVAGATERESDLTSKPSRSRRTLRTRNGRLRGVDWRGKDAAGAN